MNAHSLRHNVIAASAFMSSFICVIAFSFLLAPVPPIQVIQSAKADTIVEDLETPEVHPDEVMCLALNTYHESRGESTAGRLATMNVVVNRVEDGRWPSSICEVVKQSKKTKDGKIVKNRCAFSWYCDGEDDEPQDTEFFNSIHEEALRFLENPDRVDITDGALYYHNVNAYPTWRSTLNKTARIDNHFFYK